MNLTVLIVEDNPDVSTYLKDILNEAGFAAFVTNQGTRALKLTEKIRPDLVILDLGLPDISGESVCREVKKVFPQTPLIILTAQGNTADIVHGLSLGADDYMIKPFSGEELIARIRTCLKRQLAAGEKNLTIGDVIINTSNHDVLRGNKNIKLTKTEYNLLYFLASHKGQILTREMILNHVWSYLPDIESRTIDVYIGYLRKKIDDGREHKIIQTVNGFGYMIKDELVKRSTG